MLGAFGHWFAFYVAPGLIISAVTVFVFTTIQTRVTRRLNAEQTAAQVEAIRKITSSQTTELKEHIGDAAGARPGDDGDRGGAAGPR